MSSTDHLFYIRTLHCQDCNAPVDFYLDDRVPFCCICDSKLVVNESDIRKVRFRGKGRLKRLPVLRLNSKVSH